MYSFVRRVFQLSIFNHKVLFDFLWNTCLIVVSLNLFKSLVYCLINFYFLFLVKPLFLMYSSLYSHLFWKITVLFIFHFSFFCFFSFSWFFTNSFVCVFLVVCILFLLVSFPCLIIFSKLSSFERTWSKFVFWCKTFQYSVCKLFSWVLLVVVLY